MKEGFYSFQAVLVILIKHTVLFKSSLRGLWKSTFQWINSCTRLLLTVFENSISQGYNPSISGLSEPILADQFTLSQPGGVDYAHHITKAELLQEGIFFLIHLFARDVLVMKKLEIEKTKPTFIISVLKVEY